MATIMGTQEFLNEHKSHRVTVSLVTLYDDQHKASIEQSHFGTYVAVDDMDTREFIQIFGAHVYCDECHVEQEVNIYEVEID